MDETKLVRCMKAGDRQAFDTVYETYKNILLRMAYLVSDSMDDAEDIVQETFVKCWMHIGELKKDTGFRPWLFQILYRTAYRYTKKSRREIPDKDAGMKADATDGVTALDQVLWSETERALQEAVHSLGFKHRAAVVLFYYNDMPVKEIAKVLGTSEGTVKSRLSHARRKLSENLKRLEEGGGVYEKEQKPYLQ